MKSKTKIIVLHMKEIIYTIIFAALGILLILLLILMFHPKEQSAESDPQCCIAETNTSSSTLKKCHLPGLYSKKATVHPICGFLIAFSQSLLF